MENENHESLKIMLHQLEAEHADLNSLIDSESESLDEITLQRIKKRKLFLKDKINEIKSTIFPDIIA